MKAAERMRSVWRWLAGGRDPAFRTVAVRGRTTPGMFSPVQARVSDEDGGWSSYGHAPGDRPWSELAADLEDALEAWRRNFMVRRVVNLTRSYAVGGGITLDSGDPEAADFLARFWQHPKNRLARRLGILCDTLTRDGELFPILFTNPVDGMSYLRFKTARQIARVLTAADDYETELCYIERLPGGEEREWISPEHPWAFAPPPALPGLGPDALSSLDSRPATFGPRPATTNPEPQSLLPLMLHWSINKPVDGTRGESDLVPILPWALRYSEWLKDRVRLNRQRTRTALLDVTVADDTQVEGKRRSLRRTNPVEAGIYVHGPGETLSMHRLEINASEAEQDGRVLRLAIATGANLGLHYLGEGEGTNYATAREMGEPTARFYADRQQEVVWMLQDLVTVAYRRYCQVTGRDAGPVLARGLDLHATVAEVARADNAGLAQAAHEMMRALAIAAGEGWIDDVTALSLGLKFAGESLSGDEIRAILQRAREERAG